MTTTAKTYSLITLAFTAALVLASCSELKSDLTTGAATGLKVHPDGWLTTSAQNFHGKYVQAANFDLASCQRCHGVKFDGGTSSVSCLTCHNNSALNENCTACHGTSGTNAAPPVDLSGNTARTFAGVGAHQIHVTGGNISTTLACNACHIVPTNVLSAGHIDGVAGAEVSFNAQNFSGFPQSYTSAARTCENSYCHGNFRNGNAANAVLWTDISGTGAQCGTCHGNSALSDPEDRARPKTISGGGTHPDKGAFGTTHCSNCHGNVVDASLNWVDKSKHIDGNIN